MTCCILCIRQTIFNRNLFIIYGCLCVLVTLYGRCRGRAAWRWCLPAPARPNRWNIPQSLWTGCPLRKMIWTEADWEMCCLTQQIMHQMCSLVTESFITICLTFGTWLPAIICSLIRAGVPLPSANYASVSTNLLGICFTLPYPFHCKMIICFSDENENKMVCSDRPEIRLCWCFLSCLGLWHNWDFHSMITVPRNITVSK